MRKIIFIIMFALALVSAVYAASYVKDIWAKNSFNDNATDSDTSSAISLNSMESLELSLAVYGVDTASVYVKVDALRGTLNDPKWEQVITDSLKYPSSTYPSKGFTLRGYGTNNVKGAEYIRVRTTLADIDSSSETYYRMFLIGR